MKGSGVKFRIFLTLGAAWAGRSESEALRCQIGTSNEGRDGRRYLPYAFTEHGVVMLSSVLNSDRAIEMSILVVNAFVRMREMIASNKD